MLLVGVGFWHTVSTLRVGYFETDGFVEPSPANRRAVHRALDVLRDAGATLVPYHPPHQAEMIEQYVAATSSDGMASLRSAFGDEPMAQSLRFMWRLGTAPSSARGAAHHALNLVGEHRLANLVQAAGRKSASDLWRLTARRDQMRVDIEQAWRTAEIDVLVCPASATSAVPIGMEHDAALMFSYFGRFNVLGKPAGVVPVSRVQSAETIRARGRDRIDRRLAAITAQSLGLPVAVQVVGHRWQDETVLATLATIEAGVRASEDYPITPVLHDSLRVGPRVRPSP